MFQSMLIGLWLSIFVANSPPILWSVSISQVLVGKIHKNHHERAVVYWTWTLGLNGDGRRIWVWELFRLVNCFLY